MTDQTLKDLVEKHNSVIDKHEYTIDNLLHSVEDLITSNSETNKRLEEITKYLAKQAVFDTKLSSMDRELAESFKRVHNRIDELKDTQSSSDGCRAVQLNKKDIDNLAIEVERVANMVVSLTDTVGILSKIIDKLPTPKVIMWVLGFFIVYSIAFGQYTVNSIHQEELDINTLQSECDKEK